MENIKIRPQAQSEFVEEQGPVLEDGDIYEAVITGFNQFTNAKGEPRLVWITKVFSDEHGEVEAAGFTSLSMADGEMKSNLIKFTRNILGEIPESGVDLSELEGKPCRVQVGHYQKNGITKNKVTNFLAPKKGRKATSMQNVA